MRLLVLSHGAERTGPPIWLSRFLRWVGAETDARVEIVVARDGALVPEFRRTAEVVVASHHQEPAEPVAAALRRAGRPDLARTASDRWLRHRLRRVGHHDLVYVNSASPATVELLEHLPDSEGTTTVITHVHELDIGLRHNLSADQLGSLIRRTSMFVAVSQAVADNLVEGHGIGPDVVHVHRGFLDPAALEPVLTGGARIRKALGIPAGAFVIGSVGLPDWRKAPDLFLRTGWTLRCHHPEVDLHLLWLGGDADAPDRWQLHHEARHLGLSDRAHFVTEKADVAPYLAAMDLFALTAREDAFPLAALEAGAAGLPIVCFEAGGMPEFVRDDAGAVVPFPDTDALAAVIAELVADPARLRSLGATAQKRVRTEHDLAVRAPLLWDDLLKWAGP